MKKKIVLISSVALIGLLAGCGAPQPASIGYFDASVGINNSLLAKNYTFVPKDPRLEAINYAYEMKASRFKGEYFTNAQMVKAFLLAHNSKKIVILGDEDLINSYKHYLRRHQVTTDIYLQKLDYNPKPKIVTLLFFNNGE